MSHLNVSEVLASLQLAKDAYDAVPSLRRQIDDLEAALASKDRLLSETTDKLNATAQDKANTEAKLQSVEVERDQYFFRAEEAQEKLDKMAQLIGVKPSQAVNTPEQQSQEALHESAMKDAIHAPEPVGQSESHPTQSASNVTGQSDAETRDGVTQTQSDPGDESSKPYSGRPSWEKPYDMSWDEWRQKGGDYPHWMANAG